MASLLRPLEPVPTGYRVRLQPLSVRALVFDLYGTLFVSAAGDVGVDAATDNVLSLMQAGCDAGIPSLNRPAVAGEGISLLHQRIKQIHLQCKEDGISYPEVDIVAVWLWVLDHLGISEVRDEQVRLLALSYECRINPIWPMPGLATVLGELRDRSVVLGILSNAQFYTMELFEYLLQAPPVGCGFSPDLCLWSFREGEAKPSPHLFVRLSRRLSRLGIGPAEVLYIGNDMLKDIWPARQVGWRTGLFAGDRRSLRLREDDPRVRGVEPDIVISELGQILACL
ncbi:HAD family hydrolase [Desulfolithobacter sp.]